MDHTTPVIGVAVSSRASATHSAVPATTSTSPDSHKSTLTQSSDELRANIRRDFKFQTRSIQFVPVSLGSIPPSHLMLLSTRELIKLGADKQTSTPVMYGRLDEPVPAGDSSTFDRITDTRSVPVVFGSKGHKEQALTNGESISREHQSLFKNPISPSELIPLTIPLRIENEVDTRVWTDSVYDNMKYWCKAFKGYQQKETKNTWEKAIVNGSFETCWGDLRLFGTSNNSLRCVAQMASLLSGEVGQQILLHYITIVVWQFYLMERNRWLEVSLDPTEKYYEVSLPSFFLLFQRYDIKKNPFIPERAEWRAALFSHRNLADFARKYDFVTLLSSLVDYLIPLLNAKYFKSNPIQPTLFTEFYGGKIASNFVQLLHTSHFWPPFVLDFDKACIDSVSKVVEVPNFKHKWMFPENTKHFNGSRHHEMKRYNTGSKAQLNNTVKKADAPVASSKISSAQVYQLRIPMLHCHFFFNGENAVFQFPVTIHPEVTPVIKDLTTIEEVADEFERLMCIVDQLAFCADKKTVAETKTGLNRLHRERGRELIANPLARISTKRKKPHTSSSSVKKKTSKKSTSAVVLDSNEEAPTEQEELEASIQTSLNSVKWDPMTRVNQVRARYAYSLDPFSTLCVGLVPFLPWRDPWSIEPEYSPSFIEPRVWNWMVQRCFHNPITNLFSGYQEYKHTITEGDDEGHFDFLDTPTKMLIYVHRESTYIREFWIDPTKLPLQKYSMDYDMILYLSKVKMGLIEPDEINWFKFFYAYTLISGSEEYAAGSVTFWYYKKNQKSYSQHEIQHMTCTSYVLGVVREDYQKLRKYIKEDVYKRLKQFPSITLLIEQIKSTWDRQSPVVVSQAMWETCFSSQVIKCISSGLRSKRSDVVIQKLTTVNGEDSFAIVEDANSYQLMLFLINKLCDRLIKHDSSDLQIDSEWMLYRFSFPMNTTGEERMTLFLDVNGVNDYLIDLLSPFLTDLSYLFQHMFPSPVIKNPQDSSFSNISRMREQSPAVLEMLYSNAKNLNNTLFIDEIARLTDEKRKAESAGDVFDLPPLTIVSCNAALYQMEELERHLSGGVSYRVNYDNCSDKARAKENLRRNLHYLCTDSFLVVNKQQVVRRAVCMLTNQLARQVNDVEDCLRATMNELSSHFLASEMGEIMNRIITQAISDLPDKDRPICRARVEKYKRESRLIENEPRTTPFGKYVANLLHSHSGSNQQLRLTSSSLSSSSKSSSVPRLMQ